jgi:hypothetical protein
LQCRKQIGYGEELWLDLASDRLREIAMPNMATSEELACTSDRFREIAMPNKAMAKNWLESHENRKTKTDYTGR